MRTQVQNVHMCWMSTEIAPVNRIVSPTTTMHTIYHIGIWCAENLWLPLYERDESGKGTKQCWQRGLALRCRPITVVAAQHGLLQVPAKRQPCFIAAENFEKPNVAPREPEGAARQSCYFDCTAW